jgi:hypothetical protein
VCRANHFPGTKLTHHTHRPSVDRTSLPTPTPPPLTLSPLRAEVATLLGPGAALTESQRSALYRSYNFSSLTVLPLPSGSSYPTLTLCQEGETRAGGAGAGAGAAPEGESAPPRCVSSATKLAYAVDHAGMRVLSDPAPEDVSSALFPESNPHEPYRAAALSALQRHIAAAYAPHLMGAAQGTRGVEVFHAPDGSGNLIVVTSALVKNLPNFWAGSLRGRYVVTLRSDGAAEGGGAPTAASFAGALRIQSHYFESGNVQMRDTKEVPATAVAFAAGDASSFALALARAIAAAEDGVLVGLDDVYDGLSGHALKEVRRALPVSGTKFTWNIAGHRMVRSLQQSQSGAGAGTPTA